ncbi:MAG: TRAP transporter substrate-binding protein [Deltaproteobacteria bacterium]|nr:TRAP transporter substrate-binding protein [Deltaproteobacteria bacterium]
MGGPLIRTLLALLLVVAAGAPVALAQQAPRYTVDIATVLDPNHPLTLAGNVWARLVNERSGGRVKATVYPNSQLGGDRETIQATQGGLIQGVLDTTTKTSNFVRELAALDLPYLARSTDEAYRLLDGAIGEEMKRHALRGGFRAMSFWEASIRSVYSSRRQIRSIDDMRGLKIRVIQSPSFVTLFRALGSSPVPMAFGELYTALAQGTVDAAENDLVTYYTTKHYEVARNLAVTNHIFLVNTLWLSERFWRTLPADIQRIMQEADGEARAFLRKNRAEREQQVERLLKQAGVTFTSPDLTAFVEAARKTYPQFEERVGKELIQKILAALQQR